MGKIYERFRNRNTIMKAPPPVVAIDLEVVEEKGQWQGKCNVTACQEPPATWWNSVMCKYYCAYCAREINKSSRSVGLGEICSPGTGDELP